MRGKLGRERRKRPERGKLVGAVDALPDRIEDEEDAPVGRDGQARDDRRRAAVVARGRRRARCRPRGRSRGRGRSGRERSTSAASARGSAARPCSLRSAAPIGERQLRPRAEAGMSGNGLVDHQTVALRQAETGDEGGEVRGGAVGLRALDAIAGAPGQFDRRFRARRSRAQSCRSGGRARRAGRENRDAGVKPPKPLRRSAFPVPGPCSRDQADCLGLSVPAL